MIQVLILDRQALARDALGSLLSDARDLCVTDDTQDAGQIAETADPHAVDVVVVDQSTLAEASGAIAQLKRSRPALRTLVLANSADPEVAMAILRTGIDGYVTKNDDRLTLLTAIRRLASGGRYVCPVVGWRIAMSVLHVDAETVIH
jgi:DNA-binding NarL/FixJ family response regulator